MANYMRIVKKENTAGPNGKTESSLTRSIEACRLVAAKFYNLKHSLTNRFMKELGNSVPGQLIDQAIFEAESLAWATSFPLLFLPALAEEKVLKAQKRAEHQREIWSRQHRVLDAAWGNKPSTQYN
jgi:hypothetical protein